MSRWTLWFSMALPDAAYLDISMLDPRIRPWYTLASNVLLNGWTSLWNMPRKLANPENLLTYAMMIEMKWAAGFWLIWVQILQVALRSSSAPWLRNCWFARISASLALAQSTSSVWTHLCRRPGCGRSSHIFTNMSGGEVGIFFVRGVKHG